jgi:uncharacterized protein (TIGR02453 family)
MFNRKTVKFLKELAQNNNRDWFAVNKERYEDEVRTPALNYIESMDQHMAKISPHFIVSAKKVGGSMMRVHKDIRFSKDKTPYKTNIGIHFKHARGKDVHAPGFYLHIEPGEVFIGAGIWRPESSTLKNVRTLMDEYPKEWTKLMNKMTNKDGFELGGDSLKRPPTGFAKDHPLINDLKRKDLIAVQNLKVSAIYEKDFNKTTAKLFKAAAPLVKFICEADDLPF